MELAIHDNGSGFDLQDVKRGIGLNQCGKELNPAVENLS